MVGVVARLKSADTAAGALSIARRFRDQAVRESRRHNIV